MEFISKDSTDGISRAAHALRFGQLVAFPTETVYGLGADATNEKAVSRIYSVKGRPVGHPLIVHISSIHKLANWATDIPDYAIDLAREFWPGPMTLILRRTNLAKDYITGRQNNVGLRVPAHPIALELLEKYEELGGQGVAAPSANRFGAVSPTTVDAVCEELNDHLDSVDMVLDGGPCQVGIESTIIDCTDRQPKILRPGFITKKDLLGVRSAMFNCIETSEGLKVSGNLKRHYTPRCKVDIDSIPEQGDGFLALSHVSTPKGAVRLSSPRNSEEFARLLYQSYRKADRLGLQRIVVVIPKCTKLSTAILDRVKKSSSPL